MVLMVIMLMVSISSGVSAQDWQPAAPGSLPQWATPAGYEADGTPLYIARAPFNGGLQVGKANPTHADAYIPWGGKENPVPGFEVYCGGGKWIPGTSAAVPPGAIPGGNEADGTPLYIIRAPLEGGLVPGKFNPVYHTGYLPYGGKEREIQSFEILVQDWVPLAGMQPPPGVAAAGSEADGAPLYIIRARVGSGVHPGKLNPANGTGYVSYGGTEVEQKSGLEAFTGTGDWVAAADGEVPFGAIKAGRDDDGSPLFIIRARYQGGMHLGKMNPSSGKAYIPYGGQEIEVVAYEMLVYHFGPQG
jgi:hypothetical protein